MSRKTRRTIRQLPGPFTRKLAKVQNDLDRINRQVATLVEEAGRLERLADVAERAMVEAERLRANGG